MDNREPTRTRREGTRVTKTTTPDDKIAAIRRIVSEKQYAKIDGLMVDGFTASAIIAVFDALSPENQARYLQFSIPRMASIAFKLIK
jgi:hypothetical protein